MTTTTVPSYNAEKEDLRKQFLDMLPEEALKIWDAESEKMGQEFGDPTVVQVGDLAPEFELPNATSKLIKLKDIIQQGPVIITFYRGMWCPYCNLVLNAYQRILPEIRKLGASLVAISPQSPDSSLSTAEKNQLKFEVLSDDDNQVARQFVKVFLASEAYTAEAIKFGVDIRDFNTGDVSEVPVPAVFIIDQSGKIVYVKSEGGDYRDRVEPAEILSALKNI